MVRLTSFLIKNLLPFTPTAAPGPSTLQIVQKFPLGHLLSANPKQSVRLKSNLKSYCNASFLQSDVNVFKLFQHESREL